MIFRILSPGLACSSLVLGNLEQYTRRQGLPYYKKDLPSWLDTFALAWCQKTNSYIDNRSPRAFSFVFASTLSSQRIPMQGLAQLGFWKSPRQKNTKNGTSPWAWVGTKDQIDAVLVELGYDLETGKRIEHESPTTP